MNQLRTLLCGLLLSPCLALGQSIVAGEYFVDIDPGLGNGVAFPTVPGDSTSTTLTINPGFLPPGFHALGIRHRDTNGHWGHAAARRFYVHDIGFANPAAPSIASAEYFFDTDPGTGNGTAFPLSTGDSTFTTLVVPAGVLTPGFHTLSVRHRNANGTWSLALAQRFFLHDVQFANSPTAQLFGGEYFFDTDPGPGNGTAFGVNSGDSTNTTVLADVSALPPGFHVMGIRQHDSNGQWGHALAQRFYIHEADFANPASAPIMSGEYFFDTDPGIGNAMNFTVSNGDSVNLAFTVDASALANGFHTFGLRFQDMDGHWSHAPSRPVFIQDSVFIGSEAAPIVAAEYFYDNDPGIGSATALATGAPADSIDINTGLPVGLLLNGPHTVTVRVQDSDGNWSQPETRPFTVVDGGGAYRTIASGIWSDPAIWERYDGGNWVTTITVPSFLDSLITVRAGDTVTVNTAVTVDQVVVEAGAALLNSAYLLVADGPGTDMDVQGSITLGTGGSLAGSGLVLVNGQYYWTGGSILAGLTLEISATANAQVNYLGTLVHAGIITNAGTWTHVNGNLHGTGVFNNLATGTLLWNGSQNPDNSWQCALNNQGILHVNVTGYVTHSGNGFVNMTGGSVVVVAGELRVNGFTNAGSIVCQGSSLFRIIGGNFVNNAGSDVSLARIILAGGTLVVNVQFDITYFIFESGTINGPLAVEILTGGTFLWNGGTIGATAILNVNVGVDVTVNSAGTVYAYGTINNSGTWVHAGGNLQGTGMFNVSVTGVVNVTGTGTWQPSVYNLGGFNQLCACTFAHTGLFSNLGSGSVYVGAGQFWTSGGFTNAGLISTSVTAYFSVQGGTFTNNTGSDVSGAQVVIAGGNVIVNATFNVTYIHISGGTINGPLAVNILNGGTMLWTGGTIGATAIVNVNVGVNVTVNSAGTVYAYGTINNNGDWVHAGGNLWGTGVFNNLLSGIVDITGVLAPTNGWQNTMWNQGSVSVDVTGVFGFTGTVFTNQFGGTVTVVNGELQVNGFVNAGTITSSLTSVLRITGGTFTNDTGGDASAGTIILSAGTMVLNVQLNILHFTIEGGTVNGPLAVNILNGGTFVWTGGTIGSTAIVNINVGVAVTFNPIGTAYCDGIVNNYGTWNFDGGDLQGTGTFNNLVGAVVNINAVLDIDLSWQLVFYNAGIVNKVVPGLFTHYGSVFHNLTGGVVNVLSGEYRFKGGFINAGVITSTGTAFVCHHSGIFTNNTGGDASNGRVVIIGGDLVVNAVFNILHFRVEGGTVYGPLAVTVINGGTFGWSGGIVHATATIDINVGVVTTFSPTVTVFCDGTINNGGTWNFTGGNLHGGGAFNNLVTGVVNITGVLTSGNSWLVVLNNAGIYNYDYNGTFTHLTGVYTQVSGATLNVLQGTLVLDGVFSGSRYGVITVSFGAVLNISTTVDFLGTLITNNGTIICPELHIMGSASQTLGGNGVFSTLWIDNTAGVVLTGSINVSVTLTLVNGLVELGAYDLTLLNPALNGLVGGSITSYFICTGTGSFKRVVIGADYPFPIGTPVHFLPVFLSLTSGVQETFSARVDLGVSTEYGAPGVATGTTITNDVVGCTWVLGEDTPGGNTASVLVHWTATLEGPGFDRTDCGVGYYNGSDWTLGTLGTAGGVTVYTRLITNLILFREIIVCDGGAVLNPPSAVQVQLRALLEGPLDAGTGLMGDLLRSLGYLPTTEPYTAAGYTYTGSSGGSIAPSVLADTGNNAIVDWVLVEARSTADNSLVLYSRSALLQRDGDVVDLDGVSTLALNLPAGAYHLAIRHRNHLGCMTSTPVTLGAVAAVVDLRFAATATYGTNARKTIGAYMALWTGDVTFNGTIKYTGAGNDRDPILVRVGSTVPNNTVAGYWREDVNLNGVVKYTGSANDRDPILVNVGSTVPTNTRQQQLP